MAFSDSQLIEPSSSLFNLHKRILLYLFKNNYELIKQLRAHVPPDTNCLINLFCMYNPLKNMASI